ncbi:hypothetical protein [Polymorphospora lycopeni]|uniref:Uncharacterized protein n=1 Tax=Polymorphospora lycopeni TaxID=3140240 RepID=A0ABV5CKY5_9ACTN
MAALVALLYAVAVILAALAAFGVGGRVSLGWLGLAVLSLALALPQWQAVT